MNMNRSSMLTLAAALLIAWPMHRVVADDETQDTEIQIVAPLEATNCTGTPATITVLGLTIDVSSARIDSAPGDSASPDVKADDGGTGRHGSTDPTAGNCYYYCTPTVTPAPAQPTPVPATGGCSGLVVGQQVEVTFASDAAPLAATEVKSANAGNVTVSIEAPLQAADAGAQTVTVLGLTVDVSTASAEGADDDWTDGHSQPIDLTQLIQGQFVEVKLTSAQAPLSASELEVKNFTNQVAIDVNDDNGAVEDVDHHGNPVADCTVDVTAIVPVQGTTTTGSRIPKRLHLQTTSNGGVVISGLPTGFARLVVTRVTAAGTQVAHRGVSVRGNRTRHVRVRLRDSH